MGWEVHFLRNALALCSQQQRPLVVRLMKTITEAATHEAAKTALGAAIVDLETKAPKVARLLEKHGEEMLAVYALPPTARGASEAHAHDQHAGAAKRR